MKVGDLVRFRIYIEPKWDGVGKEVGMITDVSEPTPLLPFQVATVAFATHVFEGVNTRSLEVISECR